jgi:crotonobetainyl-CoA:carnitine CoA-transferase CaiB-like acyl-CoA transferase
MANAPFIHEQIEKWAQSLSSVREAERKLEDVGVPCIRCRSIKELADSDPHIQAREMMVSVEQPFIGPMRHYGSPLKMSETPCGVRDYSPFLGEHNSEVLSEMLSYNQTKINELYAQKVLHHELCVDQLEEWRRRAVSD